MVLSIVTACLNHRRLTLKFSEHGVQAGDLVDPKIVEDQTRHPCDEAFYARETRKDQR